jgi:hypothetical protein
LRGGSRRRSFQKIFAAINALDLKFLAWLDVGVLLPLILWGLLAATGTPGAFIARFFAGFCLIENAGYLGVGSFFGTGDCGEMLRRGSSAWALRIFGAIAVPIGFWLWNGEGRVSRSRSRAGLRSHPEVRRDASRRRGIEWERSQTLS